MPPKLRRPAAALARGRRAPGLRRPARAVDPGLGDLAEEILTADLTLEQCKGLQDIEVIAGSYWEAPATAALRVQDVGLKGGEVVLQCQVLGTQNENLLRDASNRDGRVPTGVPWLSSRRRLSSRDQVQTSRCREAALDEQHGSRSPRRTAPRRACRSSSRLRAQSGRSRPRARGSGREVSWQRERREAGQEEEPWAKEKERQVEGRRKEGSQTPFSGYGSRPRSSCAATLQAPRHEVVTAERKGCQQQFFVGNHEYQHTGSRGRRDLWRSGESAEDRTKAPRCAYLGGSKKPPRRSSRKRGGSSRRGRRLCHPYSCAITGCN